MRRLFPGDRRVWLAVAAIAPLLVLYAALTVTDPRPALAGTNSVAAVTGVSALAPGERVCTSVRVPAGTGYIEAWISTPPGARGKLHATLTPTGGTPQRLPPADLSLPGGLRYLAVGSPSVTFAGRLCMWQRGVESVGLLGGSAAYLPGEEPLVVAGQARPDADITLRYIRAEAEGGRSLLALLLDAPAHASTFRPAPIGPWTYWAIGLLVLPALAYGGLRLLATSATRSARRIALTVAAIAFVFSACWAVTTPLFQAPDEPEHVAYAQYLVETGHTPEDAPGGRGAYSSEEALLLNGMRHPSTVFMGATRPRWLRQDEQAWRATDHGTARTDGGGYTTSGHSHAPLYYGLLAPAYAAASASDLTARVTAMRLLNALLACVIAACAVLTVRELLPRHPELAAAAGLLVALQPMAGFMGGAINNDTGVNAAAAVVIYLVVRAVKRGLTPRLAVAAALALVALPLAKAVGFGVVPAAVLGLALALLRMPWRAALRGAAAFAGTFLLAALAWTRAIAPAFEQTRQAGTLANTGGAGPSSLIFFHDPVLYVDYFIQTFVPIVHLRGNHAFGWPAYEVYVKSGFAAFGWVTVQFPPLVYQIIMGVLLAAGVGAVVAAVRYRRQVLAGWRPAVVLMVAILGVFGLVAAAYVTDVPRAVPGEQGRYAFPALVPLACLAVFACLAVGRRHAVLVAGGLVVAMAGLGVAGWWMALSSFYT
jgi:hypothetical protein